MDFGKLLMYYYCNSKKNPILLSQLLSGARVYHGGRVLPHVRYALEVRFGDYGKVNLDNVTYGDYVDKWHG